MRILLLVVLSPQFRLGSQNFSIIEQNSHIEPPVQDYTRYFTYEAFEKDLIVILLCQEKFLIRGVKRAFGKNLPSVILHFHEEGVCQSLFLKILAQGARVAGDAQLFAPTLYGYQQFRNFSIILDSLPIKHAVLESKNPCYVSRSLMISQTGDNRLRVT